MLKKKLFEDPHGIWRLPVDTKTDAMVKMEVDIPRGEGFRAYYITKIEELQLVVAEKSQNLRRLQVGFINATFFSKYMFIIKMIIGCVRPSETS